MTALIVFGGVVLVLAVFQRRNLGRLLAALGAQFGKLARGAWKADPAALLQEEVDRSAAEIGKVSEGLEEYRGHVNRLERAKVTGEKEVARLEARVKNSLAAGDEAAAERYVLELKRAQEKYASDSARLAEYNQSYQNNLKKVKFARERIQQAKERASELSVELRMSKAEAETAKLAEQFNIRTNSLDGLGEIEEEIRNQIDRNRGKAQVARDLSADGLAEIEEQEKQEKQEAAALLAKMRADMGN